MKNNVLNILKDYKKWEKLKEENNYTELSYAEKNILRLENDKDCKYYKKIGFEDAESLFADTIISFWTIYQRLLYLEINWKSYKTVKSLEALINIIENNNNDTGNKIRKLNNKLEQFAKLVYTKGNFMILPNRKMNCQRYRITKDRIDMTLYECFENGELSNFFKTNLNLEEWIKKEKLDLLFLEDKICKENINWFIKNKNEPKLFAEMCSDEIFEYIENAIKFIEERNKCYLPQKPCE